MLQTERKKTLALKSLMAGRFIVLPQSQTDSLVACLTDLDSLTSNGLLTVLQTL